MSKLNRKDSRARRKRGIRKKVRGTVEQPRLTVFRSLKHIYAQVIDDQSGKIIAVVSSLEDDVQNQIKERRSAVESEVQSSDSKADVDKGSKSEEAVVKSGSKSAKEKKKQKSGKKAKKGGKAAMSAAPKVRRKTMHYRPKPAGKVLQAMVVGEVIAERCKEKGLEKVVFDRNGFRYHGRVAALADGARAKGLKF
ncbi:MAG: 50S ribosomal protein L18 [Deltaproteobacteria bacterium]|nr:50S ribosomal protein L18 [Deltaproteobacteria bacterium]